MLTGRPGRRSLTSSSGPRFCPIVLCALGTLRCTSADRLTLAVDGLPESVTHGASIISAPSGTVLAATAIAAGTRFEVEVGSLSEKAELQFVGYSDATLMPALAPGAHPGPEHVHEASRVEPLLPRADFFARATLPDGPLRAETEQPELTAGWLPHCVGDACGLLPNGVGLTPPMPEGVEKIVAATPWGNGEDAALAATVDGRFFRISADEVTELDLAPPPLDYPSLAEGADGEIWLHVQDGRLFRGRPESGFVATATVVPGPSALRVGTGADGPEAVVASRTGELGWFAGGRSQTLLTLPGGDTKVSAEWLGPGRAVASFEDLRAIVWIDSSRDPVTSLETFERGPVTLRTVPGVGLVLTAPPLPPLPSEVFLRKGERWEPIEGLPGLANSAHDVWPFAGGMMFGGYLGEIAFYHPGIGACASSRYYSTNNISVVLLTPRFVFLLGGGGRMESAARAQLIERASTGPPCRE
ncbi:MAG: hypothetical protein HYV07_13155 [Deltaproteobacteria bacterium]|nr:hypothetical protein [Deltaproteobacteria bacterium]